MFGKIGFLKKRFQHSCYPVNSDKFLKATFLCNTSINLLYNNYRLRTAKVKKMRTPLHDCL